MKPRLPGQKDVRSRLDRVTEQFSSRPTDDRHPLNRLLRVPDERNRAAAQSRPHSARQFPEWFLRRQYADATFPEPGSGAADSGYRSKAGSSYECARRIACTISPRR